MATTPALNLTQRPVVVHLAVAETGFMMSGRILGIFHEILEREDDCNVSRRTNLFTLMIFLMSLSAVLTLSGCVGLTNGSGTKNASGAPDSPMAPTLIGQ